MMIRSTTRASRLLSLAPLARRCQSTQQPNNTKYETPSPSRLGEFKATGIQGLLSTEGLQTAYFDRAECYAVRLGEELTKAQSSLNTPIEELISQHSKSDTKKAIFNYASLLYNLNFAYSNLGATRGSVTEIPAQKTVSTLLETPDLTAQIDNVPSTKLEQLITLNFGSLLEFKTLLLNSANSITGDGYTWFLARHSKEAVASKVQFDGLVIANTYNAGTPFNNYRSQQISEYQKKDPHTLATGTDKTMQEARLDMVDATEYTPLLCIDASPKAYLTDYGVFGKKTYLEQWWRAVDWDVVERRLPESALKY